MNARSDVKGRSNRAFLCQAGADEADSAGEIGWLSCDALLAIVACRRRAEVGPKGDNMIMADDRQERIRNRAHQIWLEEGQPAGQHDRHWHQAVADIDQEDAGGKSAAIMAAGAGKAKAAPNAKAAPKVAKPATKTSTPKKAAAK